MLGTMMHKDIGEYQRKIYGLTVRTGVSIVTALFLSVLTGCFFVFVLKIENEFVMIFCLLISLPIWAIGFIRPYGMKFEEFLPRWLNYSFSEHKLFYISSNYVGQEAKVPAQTKVQTKEHKKMLKAKGFERIGVVSL